MSNTLISWLLHLFNGLFGFSLVLLGLVMLFFADSPNLTRYWYIIAVVGIVWGLGGAIGSYILSGQARTAIASINMIVFAGCLGYHYFDTYRLRLEQQQARALVEENELLLAISNYDYVEAETKMKVFTKYPKYILFTLTNKTNRSIFINDDDIPNEKGIFFSAQHRIHRNGVALAHNSLRQDETLEKSTAKFLKFDAGASQTYKISIADNFNLEGVPLDEMLFLLRVRYHFKADGSDPVQKCYDSALLN